jgi:exopolyphosphatase/guanosine-5'-triphosphate,3'-diphosphate pyrophosphatase
MPSPDAPDRPRQLAAIDLGSNSFHMVIARDVDGRLQTVDRIKEMVRLAGGLQPDGTITAEAQQRAIDALALFGERLQGLDSSSVRAVGTNTLRAARRSARDFLPRAEAALGHPIEIIDGREEARLIYLGVAHGVSEAPEGRRLVLDIGGGSTELIVGEGFEPLLRESKSMGCVAYSQRHFPDGAITQRGFERATLAARRELQADRERFRTAGWRRCIGASGTNKATFKIIYRRGGARDGVTFAELEELRDLLVDIGHTDDIDDLSGLSSRRAPVYPGGLAILMALFEELDIERMNISYSALREGVLRDLQGRLEDRDIREATIEHLARSYRVDLAHARRVERTATALFEQAADAWNLAERPHRHMLRWAARLHELGLAISHSKYHKHGSYLVENSDLPGFSKQDQKALWALVRTHRRSFKPHRFDSLSSTFLAAAPRLCVLLRLAVLLQRARTDEPLPDLELHVEDERTLRLTFPDGWLEDAPLTEADLAQEADYLADADFTLHYR